MSVKYRFMGVRGVRVRNPDCVSCGTMERDAYPRNFHNSAVMRGSASTDQGGGKRCSGIIVWTNRQSGKNVLRLLIAGSQTPKAPPITKKKRATGLAAFSLTWVNASEAVNVCYWPKADIQLSPANVRFWG